MNKGPHFNISGRAVAPGAVHQRDAAHVSGHVRPPRTRMLPACARAAVAIRELARCNGCTERDRQAAPALWRQRKTSAEPARRDAEAGTAGRSQKTPGDDFSCCGAVVTGFAAVAWPALLAAAST